MRQLTKELVNNRLKKKNIALIGEYKTCKHTTRFKCLIDGYEWNQIPIEVMGRMGCPMCSRKAKVITNDYVDHILYGSNFKRIGNYSGCHIPIKFLCLKHNEEFCCEFNILKRRLKNGYGCKQCFHANRSKDNEYIDNKLKGTGIRRIGNYESNATKCEFECIEDGYRWFATPSNVLTKYVNKIKPRRIITDNEIDTRLSNRNVKRFGCVAKDRRCKFKCDICGNIWETNVYNVLQGSDCPLCKYGKTEKNIKLELDKLSIKFEHHKKFEFNGRKYYVDFYFPDNSTIIEYNGIQHYQPTRFGNSTKTDAIKRFKKQIKRDSELREFCRCNNIKLIEIKYSIKFKEVINKIVSSLQGE